MCMHAQLCSTLCEPMDCSPPISAVHGILQAGILEWIVISYFRGSSQPKNQTHVSCFGRQILNQLFHLGRSQNDSIKVLYSPFNNKEKISFPPIKKQQGKVWRNGHLSKVTQLVTWTADLQTFCIFTPVNIRVSITT